MEYIGLKSCLVIVPITLLFLVCLVISGVYAATPAPINSTTTVEVNLVGFSSYIGIQVPNKIYLGNLSKRTMLSDEVKVMLNNTGNVNLIVTPKLLDSSEEIFKNLFFRKQKTSNGTAVKPQKIGNYSIKVSAPSESEDFNAESFYMQLNLTKYSPAISNDIIGYKTQIAFIAMADI